MRLDWLSIWSSRTVTCSWRVSFSLSSSCIRSWSQQQQLLAQRLQKSTTSLSAKENWCFPLIFQVLRKFLQLYYLHIPSWEKI
jgi:hypothetical protein